MEYWSRDLQGHLVHFSKNSSTRGSPMATNWLGRSGWQPITASTGTIFPPVVWRCRFRAKPREGNEASLLPPDGHTSVLERAMKTFHQSVRLRMISVVWIWWMLRREHREDQRAEVNCAPLSEVMTAGTPKH